MNQCTRKGPKTRGQCSKFELTGHTEHYSLETDERWTDHDSDAQRTALDQRARARQAIAAVLELPARDVREVLTENRELAARFARLFAERTGARPIVIVESPYAGNVEENVRYGRAAVRQCAKAGMVPLASHLLYTQPGILNDNDPAERTLGIQLGFEMRRLAARTLVFTDLGISAGMMQGIADAERQGCPVEFCRVEGWDETVTQADRLPLAAVVAGEAESAPTVLPAATPPPFLEVGMTLTPYVSPWRRDGVVSIYDSGIPGDPLIDLRDDGGKTRYRLSSVVRSGWMLAEPFTVQP